MHRTINIISRTVVVSFLVFFVGACGDSRIATGVLLWPPENQPEAHGAVVPILEMNRNTDSFLITINEDEDPVIIEQARVERFETIEEAEAFAEAYQPFAYLYAESQQRALPVRRTQSSESQAVYRLREGEVLKIIGEASEEVSVSGLVGRWHPVLTEAGVRGYAFDFALIPFDQREGISEQARERELPVQARTIIENVWRPHTFADLIEDGTPSLEELNPDYGLFPDPSSNTIRIVSDEVSTEFSYENIVASGSRHIRFEGSDLEIRIDGTTRITVFFSVDGSDYTQRYRLLSTDLETVMEREEERRDQALSTVHADGRTLQSSSYGAITVAENGRFSWSDNDLLVPSVISPSFGSTGTVHFRHYLGSAIRDRYDGVISFRFDGAPADDYVSFLYEREPDGIRMTHAPRSSFDDLQVVRSEGSAVVIFFSYGDEPRNGQDQGSTS